jgi:hypothetical protein
VAIIVLVLVGTINCENEFGSIVVERKISCTCSDLTASGCHGQWYRNLAVNGNINSHNYVFLIE